MDHMPDLEKERAYTANVQRMLLAIIDRADQLSGSHLDQIRAIIADAWEELRLRPTELSVQEMEQLSAEVDRFAARRDFAKDQAERYRHMLKDPFFARVDFAEQGESESEKIVIGLYSLNDEQGGLLVHDWRAPICSLYYDGEPGEVGYDCPDGHIMGTLSLKRQYRMENGQLRYYVDTSVSIEDDMLLDLLSADSSRHMKQIAATIQQEQNACVRCEKAKVVGVVGGAGSGKTSVAMHRAAYLMYHQRDVLDSSRIMIVSPSTAFSEYISDVLPQLGEENVRSKTMYEIVSEIVGRKPESPAVRMDHLLTAKHPLHRRSVEYKSGPDFLKLLRTFAETYAQMGPRFGDVFMDGEIAIPSEELEGMYRNEFHLLTPAQRIERMSGTLDARMDSWAEKLSKQYEQSYSDKYHGKALKTAVQLAVTRQLQPVRNRLRELTYVRGETLLAEALRNAPERIRTAFEDNCAAGQLWWEDAVAEAYLLSRLGFARPDKHIYHILIDEAQGYSETELALLHMCYPNARVTILGDPRQRMCPGMPACRPEGWGDCFDVANAPLFELTRCYRSTRQIAEFCNRLLAESETPMIPYGRDGEAPVIAEFSTTELRERLRQLRERDYGSIAILTRTHAETDQLSEQIEHVYRLDGGEADLNYEKSDNVLAPCHMVKGMEFDAVIVVWPDTELTDAERRRLYTACSRALHSVTVLTRGELKNGLEKLL